MASGKLPELHRVPTLLEFPNYLLGEIDRKERVLDSVRDEYPRLPEATHAAQFSREAPRAPG